MMTGHEIAAAVAHSLKEHQLVIYFSLIVGFIGNKLGGDVGAWITTILSLEIGKILHGETKLDILVTPISTIISGTLIAYLFGPIMSKIMENIGKVVMVATEIEPFFWGIIVSVIDGMVLTLPISSAALCMMIGLSGLDGGVATAGRSVETVGFAMISFKENGISGLVSQGLGTSMFQISNIIKNWKIWILVTIALAITGPISIVLFKMTNIPIASGMGTLGLVGQIGTITSMSADGVDKKIFIFQF